MATPIHAPSYRSLTADTPGLGLAARNLDAVNAARKKSAGQAIPDNIVADFNAYIQNRYGGTVPAHLQDVAKQVQSGQGANAYAIAAAMEQDAVRNPAPKKFITQGPAGSGISLPAVTDVNANDIPKTGIKGVDDNIANLVRSGVPLGSAYESQKPGIDYATMLATTKKKYGGEKDMAPTGPGPFGAILTLANPVAGSLFNMGQGARSGNGLQAAAGLVGAGIAPSEAGWMGKLNNPTQPPAAWTTQPATGFGAENPFMPEASGDLWNAGGSYAPSASWAPQATQGFPGWAPDAARFSDDLLWSGKSLVPNLNTGSKVTEAVGKGLGYLDNIVPLLSAGQPLADGPSTSLTPSAPSAPSASSAPSSSGGPSSMVPGAPTDTYDVLANSTNGAGNLRGNTNPGDYFNILRTVQALYA